MSTNKRIDVICIAAVILSLLVTVLFMNGSTLGIQPKPTEMGYESRLFSQDSVHTVDIIMEDWEGFLETCTNEEYTVCTVVIDGERFSNVGLRAKGNTSLSTVASMDSNRYSFKLEFDRYDSTGSYHGLDKLSLNNLIQDNTMMKDYLSYQLMAQLGAAAPLCSYTQINVNGEPWGLYLAVEAIEESFLQRNYGSDYGELYKPDSMSNGGGRGNGKDFQMDQWEADAPQGQPQRPQGGRGQALSGEALRQALEQQGIPTDRMTGVDWTGATMEQILPQLQGVDIKALQQAMMGGNGMGGRGSSDVKLQYIDDDPGSYANIFNNAKTHITNGDKTRLVEALKRLSAGEDLENTVDVEAVIRYFVAHTFVCNDDSYTGSMIHNYYLYEKDGRLSMLPWDYNLAFGAFQGRDASSAVNASIHSPVSGDLSDRPMIAWIFGDEVYTQMYDRIYQELLQLDLTGLVDRTAKLIAPCVQEDPTKFCTYEEFETGVCALKKFLQLRSESVAQQLTGEQGTVDTGDLNLSDMGSMGMGGMNRPQNGEAMQPPTGEMPQQGMNGYMQPPTGEMPQQGMGGAMQPPIGEMPQQGMNGDMQPPMGNRPQGGMGQQRPGREPPGQFFPNPQTDAAQPTDPHRRNTSEPTGNNGGLLLTVLSAAVLLTGILLASSYRRRKIEQ